MARTGTQENKDSQRETAAQQKQSFDVGQAGVKKYNANVDTLASGGNVGENPFMSADYLSNVNKLRSGTLNAQNDAAKTQLEDLNTRTGGLGQSATRYGISDLAMKKMRLGDQLGAQQGAQDFGRNLEWQRYLAEAPLQSTAAEQGMYGTATTGRDAALNNLTQFGLAQYGPYNALIQAAGGAAAGALSAKT